MSEGAYTGYRAPLSAYVAGRTRDIERVRRAQNLCRDAGIEIAFDWTDVEGPDAQGEIRKSWAGAPERARVLAQRELDACSRADLTILMWRSGGLGAFFETAFAMAAQKDVWIVGPDRDSVFFYLPGVVIVQEDDLDIFVRRYAITRTI